MVGTFGAMEIEALFLFLLSHNFYVPLECFACAGQCRDNHTVAQQSRENATEGLPLTTLVIDEGSSYIDIHEIKCLGCSNSGLWTWQNCAGMYT